MSGHLPQERTSKQSQEQKVFGMKKQCSQKIGAFQGVLDTNLVHATVFVCARVCAHVMLVCASEQ